MDSELQFLALINDKVQTFIKMGGGPIGIPEEVAGLIEARMVQLQQHSEVLRYRDRVIEIEVLNLLPQDARDAFREGLHGAIEKAAREWEREYLPILVGGK